MTNPAATEVTALQAELPKMKRKGRALLLYDLKHPKLIPFKVLNFILLSGVGVLFPFVTIHMKSLGMTVEETGAILGVSSVAAIISPFLVGLIADRIGNFKVLMCALYTFIALVSLSFLLIPAGRISTKFPVNMTLAIGCNSDQVTLRLTDLDSHLCQLQSTNEDLANVSLVLEECGYICFNKTQPPEENELGRYLNSRYPINSDDPSPTREFRDAVFFQNDWNLNSTCTQMSNGEEICVTQHGDRQLSNMQLELVVSANSTNVTDPFSIKWMGMANGNSNFLCGFNGNEQKMHETYYVYDTNETSSNQTLYRSCRPQCIVKVNRSDLCSNMADEEDLNPQLTFWIYMLLRFTFELSLGGFDLFVGAAVAVVNQVGGDFGFQRMFGYIGIAIFSPLSGALIDSYSTANNGQGNVAPAFCFFAGICFIAALGMLTVNLDFKPPVENPFKDLGSVLKNIRLDVLLIVSLVFGTINSFCSSYLFLFLQDIGGTRALMGLSNTFQSVTVIPLLLISDFIFRKLGHPNLQIFSLSVNFIRLLGYSFLYDPRLCLLFESMDALCHNIARTSQIAYANELGTLTTVASIQGLLGAITFGLGQGVGSVVGSLLIGSFGQRVAFRIMASISLITGILYFIFNLRLKNKEREK